MTTKKTDAEPVAAVAETVASIEPVKALVFRDKEFTSRTLILAEGRTVQVVRGLVEATDPELLSFLRARSSFEPVMG